MSHIVPERPARWEHPRDACLKHDREAELGAAVIESRGGTGERFFLSCTHNDTQLSYTVEQIAAVPAAVRQEHPT